MSFPTAAILKAIHDIALSHSFIILFISIFALSAMLSILLVVVLLDDSNCRISRETDEERGTASWWNPAPPQYSPIQVSEDSCLAQASMMNSPVEISREEEELLLAVHQEYMRDDLKRLIGLEGALRGE